MNTTVTTPPALVPINTTLAWSTSSQGCLSNDRDFHTAWAALVDGAAAELLLQPLARAWAELGYLALPVDDPDAVEEGLDEDLLDTAWRLYDQAADDLDPHEIMRAAGIDDEYRAWLHRERR